MGLELELDYEKNGRVGLSPNTVLPPPKQSSSYSKKRGTTTKGKYPRKDELLVLKGDFREISFSRYHRSVSCKNAPTRRVSQEGNSEFRRGSVYQTSREVRRMKDMGGALGERRKIEISRSSDISFSVVDSLCSLDEEKIKIKRQPLKAPIDSSSSNGFFEICLDPKRRGNNNSAQTIDHRGGSMASISDLRSDRVVVPLSNGNEPLERDSMKALPKSISAKVETPSSPDIYETDCSSKTNYSKTRFNPVRKMFDPFVKSKSLRSPGEIKPSGSTNLRRNKTCSKSLSLEFSESKQDSISSSPVYLHGNLKLENKHGFPLFEFSLQSPEDIFVAKRWKARDAFNWVYTFHSVENGKKSNASQSGLFDSDNNKECSTVGQMRVSCYLCSELKDGAFENSMVTEFVLYDISRARPGVSCQENLTLTPSQEIAAVVMRAPFEKRESLKHKRGDTKSDDEKMCRNLLNLSIVEPRERKLGDSRTSLDEVKVVIPAGTHGLPSSESGSPSSLLDRWRLGGGCDCGGWDMACPLTVLGNPHFQCPNSQSLVENQIRMELFVQGNKDDRPTLTMTFVEEGLYSVDFHAQLSTLQAFSICVAVLHGTETTSSDSTKERAQELLNGDAVKVVIDEEVKFLIETVEKHKNVTTKRVKETRTSYALNPPFSPIARV